MRLLSPCISLFYCFSKHTFVISLFCCKQICGTYLNKLFYNQITEDHLVGVSQTKNGHKLLHVNTIKNKTELFYMKWSIVDKLTETRLVSL